MVALSVYGGFLIDDFSGIKTKLLLDKDWTFSYRNQSINASSVFINETFIYKNETFIFIIKACGYRLMLGNDNFVTGWAEVCNKQTATLLYSYDK